MTVEGVGDNVFGKAIAESNENMLKGYMAVSLGSQVKWVGRIGQLYLNWDTIVPFDRVILHPDDVEDLKSFIAKMKTESN